jgi:hypothetical protein
MINQLPRRLARPLAPNFSSFCLFVRFQMNLAAMIVDEQGNVQDETLKSLLSDKLFNEFDCAHWISAADDNRDEFAERAFPVLIKYHLGKELDKLVSNHQWLADMSIPSKRHKSANFFHLNSAQNLTILDFFAKL